MWGSNRLNRLEKLIKNVGDLKEMCDVNLIAGTEKQK